MVRQWQELFWNKRYSHTELVNPDFIKVAEGFGIEGKKVTKREDLNKTMDEMIQSKKAYFLEVSIDKEANVFPMVPAGASVSEVIFG